MLQIQELFKTGFWDFLRNTLIYAVVAIPFFLIFWVLFKKQFKQRRIQQKERRSPEILWHEIKFSISTLLIFTFVDIGLYIAHLNGYTRMYDHISEKGWLYFLVSILGLILVQDTWFYWTHRLMHQPKIFRLIHNVHHRSVDPSPFAAFSFHPAEAFVEAGTYILFAFLFPVNYWALISWQIVQMAFNVIGHLGYEIYPQGFNTHWLFKHKTPSTHHNMHHSGFNGNYGLYFTWWDRWCKTEFKDYHKTYVDLQERITQEKNNLTRFLSK